MFTAVLIFSAAQTSVVVLLLPLPLGEGWGEGLSASRFAPSLTSPKGRGINTLFQAIRLITSQRKIFPERVALPIVGQKYAPQIGMADENHSKQIVRFALVPVRRAPYAAYRRHVNVVFVQQNLQAQAMMQGDRE